MDYLTIIFIVAAFVGGLSLGGIIVYFALKDAQSENIMRYHSDMLTSVYDCRD